MRNSTGAAATGSYPMNAGNGSHSYSKNSYLQANDPSFFAHFRYVDMN